MKSSFPVALFLGSTLLIACSGDSGGATDSAGSSSSAGSTGSGSTGSGTDTTGGGSGTDSGTGTDSTGSSTSGTSASTGESTGGVDPWDAPPMCSSNKMWNLGEIEDPHMHPGRICLDCHMQSGKPFIKDRFQIAGTVYPSGHEPDECYGADGVALGIEVEVKDAMGKVYTMPVNDAGNFMYQAAPGTVAFPITALVRRGGVEWAMETPQNSADCNSCHTQDGANNAKGRIVAP